MRLDKIWRAVAVGLTILALPGGIVLAADEQLSFFDPVVTITPGITREVDVLFDHVRTASSQLSQPSLRLQYPVRS